MLLSPELDKWGREGRSSGAGRPPVVCHPLSQAAWLPQGAAAGIGRGAWSPGENNQLANYCPGTERAPGAVPLLQARSPLSFRPLHPRTKIRGLTVSPRPPVPKRVAAIGRDHEGGGQRCRPGLDFPLLGRLPWTTPSTQNAPPNRPSSCFFCALPYLARGGAFKTDLTALVIFRGPGGTYGI